MYTDLSSFYPCYATDRSFLKLRVSKNTTPSKVAKQATKATTPKRPATTNPPLSRLNEQDIRTLWFSFRNNGGTKVNIPTLAIQAFIDLDSPPVFYHEKFADSFMTIQNPNFDALGMELGVSTAAARWRFYKLKAIFEGESGSPKNAKTATLKKKTKKGSKRKLGEESDDECAASWILKSDGDFDQKPETSVKAETGADVKKEPGLDVRPESDTLCKGHYDLTMEYDDI
jgi:hypothetical protein